MFYREFNENGYPVFGLHGVTRDGFCECLNPKCEALYKHPKTSAWQHTPVWEEDQLEVMELTDSFKTGYGVLCKGLLVVDVDARNGGLDSYNKLIQDCPEILEAGMIVETGSGGGSKHLFFKIDKDLKLQQHLKKYPGIDFKSSGFVVGAGSKHKSGNLYKCVFGSPDEIEYAPKEILSLLEAKETQKHTSTYNGESLELTEAQFEDILDFIPNDASLEYDEWIMVGMAIHEATQSGGYDLWVKWSEKSPKHDDSQMLMKWKSFGKNPNRYTVGTLIHLAKENGYEFKHDVDMQELDSNIDWSKKPEPKTVEFDPLNPPFLAGDIAKWINSNSFYPRERLAVASALMAISSACGLRYRGYNDTTANMFMFCVAGSGTGKESIMQSYTKLLKEIGISQAMHGGIISEQELTRNIVDHQASFYTIDEFGEILSKIQNARKKGTGNSHLEGIVGSLMSIFSKANGIYLVPQTHKKAFRENLIKEVSKIKMRIDENEQLPTDEAELERLGKRLEELETGILNPYINILGFSTPERFSTLLDEDMADNGFFGRALIVREMDDNPRKNANFGTANESDYKVITNRLFNLYAGGTTPVGRVEQLGNIINIPCNEKVTALLDQISEEFWNIGEEQRENQGFLAYVRRCAELVNKLSLVLSVSEGELKEEAVMWAYHFVKQNLYDKTVMTKANVQTGAADKLINKILSKLDKDAGVSIGVLKGKLRSFKPEDIESAIKYLVEKKIILGKEEQAARGPITIKYYKI